MIADERRIKKVNTSVEKGSGTVVYWMRRDQRIDENWAFIHAVEKAISYGVPLIVYFQLYRNYRHPYRRHFDFMLRGLEEVEQKCIKIGVGTRIVVGNGLEDLKAFLEEVEACLLVTDHSPLRGPSRQVSTIKRQVNIPIHLVDAHNMIPVWEVSDKQEYAARTIRRKIYDQLDQFLVNFPDVVELTEQLNVSANQNRLSKTDFDDLKSQLDLKPPEAVSWLVPGHDAGMSKLEEFITIKLPNYAKKRNDPNEDVLSDLSAYIHFGQISAQKVIQEVLAKENSGSDVFVEEVLIRRELSENYCYYNPDYDRFVGLPEWGRRTLGKHSLDDREYVYIEDEFERAVTHDPLWNAAQLQMIHTGKMHGYIRMYWAKKILEWTETPQEAQRIAIYLNDKYELDGRDPNGYTGIAWAIGGLHDRPWTERQVFGNIRYMNYNGAKRKFKVDEYISNNSYNS